MSVIQRQRNFSDSIDTSKNLIHPNSTITTTESPLEWGPRGFARGFLKFSKYSVGLFVLFEMFLVVYFKTVYLQEKLREP
jgi:hypothetical protein